jgi:NADH-quinone oxidoreductase subunit N
MTSLHMPTPSVEYGLLSPIFIVFGVAVVGVLVEAFLPRRARYGAQVLLALGGLIAAAVADVIVARQLDPPGRYAVLHALAIDGPTLLLQGAILLVAVLAVFFFAERHHGDNPAAGPGAATATAHVHAGLDSFTPQASAVPDSAAEHEAERAGASQTEVFPLTMLAVGGMLVFPAANDLLTMFVALEVLSLPLYLLCGLARHRRLQSQEAAVKYFLLGAFSSAFFLYGAAFLYGATNTLSDCCSKSVRCRSIRGSPTSTRAPRPRSPGSWPRPPRSRRSARCCESSTWRCHRCTTSGGPCCGPSRS